MPVQPARTTTYRVLWYEAVSARALLAGGTTRTMPAKAKRLGVYSVTARTLDGARKAAREHLSQRGHRVVTVNFSSRHKDTILVYTKGA